MRYPQGGGLTAERRAFREEVRLEAAVRFAAGLDNAAIARELRVHVRSVQRWRLAWAGGGEAAVAVWAKETWPQVEERRRRSGPGSSSKTKPGSR